MCTVSFIPAGNRVFITSNRDEQSGRHTTLTPGVHHHNGITACYVTDLQAGGTWCGMNDNGMIAVLLNGGREKPVLHPPYPLSRGLVVKQLLHEQNPLNFLHTCGLEGAAPFTLVVYNCLQLFELVWNGHEKAYRQLSTAKGHIWASTTLYNAAAKRQKQLRLANWLRRHNGVNPQSITGLHRQMRYEESIPRPQQIPGLQTVSISVMEHDNRSVNMWYHALNRPARTFVNYLPVQSTTVYANPLQPFHP